MPSARMRMTGRRSVAYACPMRGRRPVLTLLAVLAVLLTAGFDSGAVRAHLVADGLAYPSQFTFAADGRIVYGERLTGRVRLLDPATGADTVVHRVDRLCTDADQGLFGIALDPGWLENRTLWLYATRRGFDGVCRNQLYELAPDADGRLRLRVLWGTPYTGEHIGGRLLLGPDGNLHLSTGDGDDPAAAQDLASGHGKVLRFDRSGRPLPDGIGGGPVWAYGFRNVFGMAVDPRTGRMWATDNGPACNDEVNVLRRGANYGWGPNATCSTPPAPPSNTNRDGPDPVPPVHWWSPSDGPTGLAFCDGCGLGDETEGTLLYGAWRLGEIRRLTLDDRRDGVRAETVLYTHHRPEAPLAMEVAPDGSIWFSDDRAIYQLQPK
jgi:aldose sugar dehydrogenase